MAVCYVVGAGDCTSLDFERKSGDLIIAADGGYKYLASAGIKPDILIGDFDSLGDIPENENIVRLNPVKDITDMDAAVGIGIEKGYSEFVIYGALGGRFDHSLANIQLLARLSQQGKKAELRNGETVITAVTDGKITFDSSHKGYVSVFSHSDICEKVCIRGLKYTLEDAALKNTFTLGISNEFIGSESEIIIEKGTAIIIYNP
ncbi:MAG: thiamine diphosphokinase [Clostridia bacterium]|nr:thiamine diphosphokinase [Clostridia bacterium]